MKRFIASILVVILLFSLTACGSKETIAPQTNNSDKIVLRVGSTTEPDGHYVKGVKEFKAKVEEYTQGKVEVRIFPSSQLGNERDLVEGVGLGTLEMAIVSIGPLPNFSSDFLLFDLPFIITDRDKAYEVMDGEIGQAILASLEPKGIKALGFWENGFRHITNNNKAIVHPEDVAGLKIRTMENPIHIDTFKHLKSIPTPMGWGEVFTALQQGTIDGQENPLVIIATNKLWEAQRHLSLTGHFYSPAVFMINKAKFDGFSQDIQEAILKAEKEARDWERDYSRQLDEKLATELNDNGFIVTEVDKGEWIEFVQPVYDLYKDKINQDYIKALLGN